jgi:hypothetical protein
MSRNLNGSQQPPLPRIAENGWGPKYPIGMTDLDLLVYSPTMYDLYRTNGGMGSGMVDRFSYDPITQYGNLSSSVANGLGSSDLWFSLMNHRYPYRKYPFTSVENMESGYNQPQKQLSMGIAEQTGTGYFTSLNDESNMVAATSGKTTPTKGGQMVNTSSGPIMLPSTAPTVPTQPKTCPPGTKLMYNKCVPIIAVSGSTVVTKPTLNVSRPPVTTPAPTPVPVPVLVPVQAPPMSGGGAMGGGGGGGEAPAETTAEKGAEMGIEKISYTIPLVLAVLGAVGGYFYAKKAGKKIAVFAAGGAIIGFAAGYFYTKFKMKKDSEAASKAPQK